MKQKKLTEVT